MSMTTLQQRKLAQVLSEHHIQRMIEIEPPLLALLQVAADPEPRDNRWLSYEAIKRMAAPYVGWDARHEELRSSVQYELLMCAVDTLLPESEEERSA